MSTTFTAIVSQNSRPPKYTRHYQPRHPLAKRIIEQIESLEIRPQTIVQTMGYLPKHTIPACDRLRHVLSNPYLGLDGSYQDARFGAEKFLAELLSIVDIKYETAAEDIAQIQYRLANQSTHTLSKKPSIAKIDFDYS
ncbi:hypothetical protein M0N77_04300 [Psychrobacter sp. AH5]|uniref:hypothetical protein n=1 Tax=Psychrobacter sp. AH5 TaxID=2937433 RepID=UPI00334015AB